jgi:hypothetical protein
MKHRYLSTKVILPVADGSVLLAPEVLDVSIVIIYIIVSIDAHMIQ